MILGNFLQRNGGAVSGHWLSTKQGGGFWYEQGSSARITDDGPNPDPAVSGASPLSTAQWTELDGSLGVAAALEAFNGGALDATNNRIYMPGKGHTDCLGNSIEYFDFNIENAEVYGSEAYPSYPIASDTSGVNPDGSPDARHVYCSSVVVGDYLYFSGRYSNVNANGNVKLWRRHLTNNTYESAPSTGLTYNTDANYKFVVVCYNPTDGLLWCWNQYELATIDPTDFSSGFTSRRTYVGNWNFNGEGSKFGAIDVAKQKMLVMGYDGANESVIFDISTPSSVTESAIDTTPRTEITWSGTGASAVQAAGGCGISYDSANEDLVVWNGGTGVYTIDLSTTTITSVAANGSNTTTPPSMTANGVFNRFCYHAEHDAFIMLNASAQPAYYYKR